jgi:hypothetical protein
MESAGTIKPHPFFDFSEKHHGVIKIHEHLDLHISNSQRNTAHPYMYCKNMEEHIDIPKENTVFLLEKDANSCKIRKILVEPDEKPSGHIGKKEYYTYKGYNYFLLDHQQSYEIHYHGEVKLSLTHKPCWKMMKHF